MIASKRPRFIRWTVLSLGSLGLAVVAGVASSEDPPTVQPGAEERPAEAVSEEEASRRSPRAAARVVLDPETGELRSEPVKIEWRQMSPKLRARLSRRSDDLYLEPLPSGGFMVDLQGRFQTLLVAEVRSDGTVRMRCVDELPKVASPGAAETPDPKPDLLDAVGGEDE